MSSYRDDQFGLATYPEYTIFSDWATRRVLEDPRTSMCKIEFLFETSRAEHKPCGGFFFRGLRLNNHVVLTLNLCFCRNCNYQNCLDLVLRLGRQWHHAIVSLFELCGEYCWGDSGNGKKRQVLLSEGTPDRVRWRSWDGISWDPDLRIMLSSS